MDLSFALARKTGAELVLANDPDADRLAVAVPSTESPTGYVQLTGNQVGVLLGHYLLTESRGPGRASRCVLVSIVSSPLLGVIAEALGVALRGDAHRLQVDREPRDGPRARGGAPSASSSATRRLSGTPSVTSFATRMASAPRS